MLRSFAYSRCAFASSPRGSASAGGSFERRVGRPRPGHNVADIRVQEGRPYSEREAKRGGKRKGAIVRFVLGGRRGVQDR